MQHETNPQKEVPMMENKDSALAAGSDSASSSAEPPQERETRSSRRRSSSAATCDDERPMSEAAVEHSQVDTPDQEKSDKPGTPGRRILCRNRIMPPSAADNVDSSDSSNEGASCTSHISIDTESSRGENSTRITGSEGRTRLVRSVSETTVVLPTPRQTRNRNSVSTVSSASPASHTPAAGRVTRHRLSTSTAKPENSRPVIGATTPIAEISPARRLTRRTSVNSGSTSTQRLEGEPSSSKGPNIGEPTSELRSSPCEPARDGQPAPSHMQELHPPELSLEVVPDDSKPTQVLEPTSRPPSLESEYSPTEAMQDLGLAGDTPSAGFTPKELESVSIICNAEPDVTSDDLRQKSALISVDAAHGSNPTNRVLESVPNKPTPELEPPQATTTAQEQRPVVARSEAGNVGDNTSPPVLKAGTLSEIPMEASNQGTHLHAQDCGQTEKSQGNANAMKREVENAEASSEKTVTERPTTRITRRSQIEVLSDTTSLSLPADRRRPRRVGGSVSTTGKTITDIASPVFDAPKRNTRQSTPRNADGGSAAKPKSTLRSSHSTRLSTSDITGVVSDTTGEDSCDADPSFFGFTAESVGDDAPAGWRGVLERMRLSDADLTASSRDSIMVGILIESASVIPDSCPTDDHMCWVDREGSTQSAGASDVGDGTLVRSRRRKQSVPITTSRAARSRGHRSNQLGADISATVPAEGEELKIVVDESNSRTSVAGTSRNSARPRTRRSGAPNVENAPSPPGDSKSEHTDGGKSADADKSSVSGLCSRRTRQQDTEPTPPPIQEPQSSVAKELATSTRSHRIIQPHTDDVSTPLEPEDVAVPLGGSKIVPKERRTPSADESSTARSRRRSKRLEEEATRSPSEGSSSTVAEEPSSAKTRSRRSAFPEPEATVTPSEESVQPEKLPAGQEPAVKRSRRLSKRSDVETTSERFGASKVKHEGADKSKSAAESSAVKPRTRRRMLHEDELVSSSSEEYKAKVKEWENSSGQEPPSTAEPRHMQGKSDAGSALSTVVLNTATSPSVSETPPNTSDTVDSASGSSGSTAKPRILRSGQSTGHAPALAERASSVEEMTPTTEETKPMEKSQPLADETTRSEARDLRRGKSTDDIPALAERSCVDEELTSTAEEAKLIGEALHLADGSSLIKSLHLRSRQSIVAVPAALKKSSTDEDTVSATADIKTIEGTDATDGPPCSKSHTLRSKQSVDDTMSAHESVGAQKPTYVKESMSAAETSATKSLQRCSQQLTADSISANFGNSKPAEASHVSLGTASFPDVKHEAIEKSGTSGIRSLRHRGRQADDSTTVILEAPKPAEKPALADVIGIEATSKTTEDRKLLDTETSTATAAEKSSQDADSSTLGEESVSARSIRRRSSRHSISAPPIDITESTTADKSSSFNEITDKEPTSEHVSSSTSISSSKCQVKQLPADTDSSVTAPSPAAQPAADPPANQVRSRRSENVHVQAELKATGEFKNIPESKTTDESKYLGKPKSAEESMTSEKSVIAAQKPTLTESMSVPADISDMKHQTTTPDMKPKTSSSAVRPRRRCSEQAVDVISDAAPGNAAKPVQPLTAIESDQRTACSEGIIASRVHGSRKLSVEGDSFVAVESMPAQTSTFTESAMAGESSAAGQESVPGEESAAGSGIRHSKQLAVDNPAKHDVETTRTSKSLLSGEESTTTDTPIAGVLSTPSEKTFVGPRSRQKRPLTVGGDDVPPKPGNNSFKSPEGSVSAEKLPAIVAAKPSTSKASGGSGVASTATTGTPVKPVTGKKPSSDSIRSKIGSMMARGQIDLGGRALVVSLRRLDTDTTAGVSLPSGPQGDGPRSVKRPRLSDKPLLARKAADFSELGPSDSGGDTAALRAAGRKPVDGGKIKQHQMSGGGDGVETPPSKTKLRGPASVQMRKMMGQKLSKSDYSQPRKTVGLKVAHQLREPARRVKRKPTKLRICYVHEMEDLCPSPDTPPDSGEEDEPFEGFSAESLGLQPTLPVKTLPTPNLKIGQFAKPKPVDASSVKRQELDGKERRKSDSFSSRKYSLGKRGRPSSEKLGRSDSSDNSSRRHSSSDKQADRSSIGSGSKSSPDKYRSEKSASSSSRRQSSCKDELKSDSSKHSSPKAKHLSSKERLSSNKDKHSSSKEQCSSSKDKHYSSKERHFSSKDKRSSSKERQFSKKDKYSLSEDYPSSNNEKYSSSKDRHESKDKHSSSKDRHDSKDKYSSNKDHPESMDKYSSNKDRRESKDKYSSSKDRHESKDKCASSKDKHPLSRDKCSSSKDRYETKDRHSSSKHPRSDKDRDRDSRKHHSSDSHRHRSSERSSSHKHSSSHGRSEKSSSSSSRPQLSSDKPRPDKFVTDRRSEQRPTDGVERTANIITDTKAEPIVVVQAMEASAASKDEYVPKAASMETEEGKVRGEEAFGTMADHTDAADAKIETDVQECKNIGDTGPESKAEQTDVDSSPKLVAEEPEGDAASKLAVKEVDIAPKSETEQVEADAAAKLEVKQGDTALKSEAVRIEVASVPKSEAAPSAEENPPVRAETERADGTAEPALKSAEEEETKVIEGEHVITAHKDEDPEGGYFSAMAVDVPAVSNTESEKRMHEAKSDQNRPIVPEDKEIDSEDALWSDIMMDDGAYDGPASSTATVGSTSTILYASAEQYNVAYSGGTLVTAEPTSSSEMIAKQLPDMSEMNPKCVSDGANELSGADDQVSVTADSQSKLRSETVIVLSQREAVQVQTATPEQSQPLDSAPERKPVNAETRSEPAVSSEAGEATAVVTFDGTAGTVSVEEQPSTLAKNGENAARGVEGDVSCVADSTAIGTETGVGVSNTPGKNSTVEGAEAGGPTAAEVDGDVAKASPATDSAAEPSFATYTSAPSTDASANAEEGDDAAEMRAPVKRLAFAPSTTGPEGEEAEKGGAKLAAVKARGKAAESRLNVARLEKKLRSYQAITDSVWLRPSKVTKQQKETRRMVCECSISPEELTRGDQGCGPDCLNRLLMIECSTRCPLGERCSNRRFTRRRYCRTEVFRTENKGYGLRTLQPLPAGTFICEYVGEVVDLRDFRRRRKEYARLGHPHQYFMALRGDTIVDATEKGNDSRFINHSCEPNSETQKWTVNGELRIGFFTQRAVSAGEEITCDYKLRMYGGRSQRCLCDSRLCRGWIGATPDVQQPQQDEEEEQEEERAEEPQLPERRPQPRRDAAQRELGDEISRLAACGLKSREHTLQLSRLMVRAESDADRRSLLSLLRSADQPCRRLFLDYHGLKLLWTWMASVPVSGDPDWQALRRELLETLALLPIPNRAALRESRVLAAVERWAQASRPSTPPTPDTDPPSDHTPPESAAQDTADVAPLAHKLLNAWNNLQDVYRIPKKERLQMMREHEREADRGYQTYLQQQTRASSQQTKRGYNCSPEHRPYKRARHSPERAKPLRHDDGLSTQERRKLFMLKVQQEESERRLAALQEAQRQRQQQLKQLKAEQQQQTAADRAAVENEAAERATAEKLLAEKAAKAAAELPSFTRLPPPPVVVVPAVSVDLSIPPPGIRAPLLPTPGHVITHPPPAAAGVLPTPGHVITHPPPTAAGHLPTPSHGTAQPPPATGLLPTPSHAPQPTAAASLLPTPHDASQPLPAAGMLPSTPQPAPGAGLLPTPQPALGAGLLPTPALSTPQPALGAGLLPAPSEGASAQPGSSQTSQQADEQQQQLWKGHEQRCGMLGLDPHLTPIFDPSFQYYWEPSSGAWQPYTPGDPAVPLVAAAGADPALLAALPHHLAVCQTMAAVDLQQAQRYLQRVSRRQPAPVPAPGQLPSEAAPAPPVAVTSTQTRPPATATAVELNRIGLFELLQSQIEGRFGRAAAAAEDVTVAAPVTSAETSVVAAASRVASIPLPAEKRRESGSQAPPPPPPAESTSSQPRLPANWKQATDQLGRVYYYHQVTLETKWELPADPDSTVADSPVRHAPTVIGPQTPPGQPSSGSAASSSSGTTSSSSSASSSDSSSSDSDLSDSSDSVQGRSSDGSSGRRRRQGRSSRHHRRHRRGSPTTDSEAERSEELEEGEIRDQEQSEQKPPGTETESKPDKQETAELTREEARRRRRERREAARRERRRVRECERLLRRHRRKMEEAGMNRVPGDEAKITREQAIKLFKAKEEALQQATRDQQQRSTGSGSDPGSAAKRARPGTPPPPPPPQETPPPAPSTSGQPRSETDAQFKIKEKFLAHMSAVVVSVLNNYFTPNCKQGRITTTEDFKYLAKKLTHHILLKELRLVDQRVEKLLATVLNRQKARLYVRQYMSRYGPLYGQNIPPVIPHPISAGAAAATAEVARHKL